MEPPIPRSCESGRSPMTSGTRYTSAPFQSRTPKKWVKLEVKLPSESGRRDMPVGGSPGFQRGLAHVGVRRVERRLVAADDRELRP